MSRLIFPAVVILSTLVFGGYVADIIAGGFSNIAGAISAVSGK